MNVGGLRAEFATQNSHALLYDPLLRSSPSRVEGPNHLLLPVGQQHGQAVSRQYCQRYPWHARNQAIARKLAGGGAPYNMDDVRVDLAIDDQRPRLALSRCSKRDQKTFPIPGDVFAVVGASEPQVQAAAAVCCAFPSAAGAETVNQPVDLLKTRRLLDLQPVRSALCFCEFDRACHFHILIECAGFPQPPAMKEKPLFRVATYNTHKCRGMDGRIRPHRVAEVLRELDADVIALQEVVSLSGARREQDQARYLADAVGFEFRIGETRKLRGASYGNVVLSRLPLKSVEVYDLTASRREPRGCIRCDLEIAPGKIVHLFNVHLGTGYLERRKQAHLLMSREVLCSPQLKHPRLVIGDFNEWTRGLVSRRLQHEFESVDIELHLQRRRTYPGVLPIMHLDHMYFDRELALEEFLLHRSRIALMASDHLPLLAEFRVGR